MSSISRIGDDAPANGTADFLTPSFLAVSSVYRIEIAAHIAEEYNTSGRRGHAAPYGVAGLHSRFTNAGDGVAHVNPTSPSAEGIARQLTEAYALGTGTAIHHSRSGWGYGDLLIRRLRALGIRDRPIAPRSPWQNAHTERFIGSIRRECLDHVVVFDEEHLRQLPGSYQRYYNAARTHLLLNKDAPASRAAQAVGHIEAVPHLGGLHPINMFGFDFW